MGVGTVVLELVLRENGKGNKSQAVNMCGPSDKGEEDAWQMDSSTGSRPHSESPAWLSEHHISHIFLLYWPFFLCDLSESSSS